MISVENDHFFAMLFQEIDQAITILPNKKGHEPFEQTKLTQFLSSLNYNVNQHKYLSNYKCKIIYWTVWGEYQKHQKCFLTFIFK